jgi:hypothetical protein
VTNGLACQTRTCLSRPLSSSQLPPAYSDVHARTSRALDKDLNALPTDTMRG